MVISSAETGYNLIPTATGSYSKLGDCSDLHLNGEQAAQYNIKKGCSCYFYRHVNKRVRHQDIRVDANSRCVASMTAAETISVLGWDRSVARISPRDISLRRISAALASKMGRSGSIRCRQD